jgi:hypothetical protein
MLVSTFELLVTKIAPPGGSPADSIVRNVVQAYFLNIANPNGLDAYLELQFTATSPSLRRDNTVIIRDVSNNNEFDELTATGDPNKFTYHFMLPAQDTALIDLQPDILKQEVLDKGLEVRGYVEIFLVKPSDSSLPFVEQGDFLLTPEHRGTFFKSLTPPDQQLDQEALGLPTATGSALFSLAI